MNGLELKLAYVNYVDNNLRECIRLIDRYINLCFGDDLDLDKDLFLKKLSKDIFKAIILNEFYYLREVKGDEIINLFSDYEYVKDNIKSFCVNFGGYESVDFMVFLKRCTVKMLESSIDIINDKLKMQCKC